MYRTQHLCRLFIALLATAVTAVGITSPCDAAHEDCDAAGGDMVELLQEFSVITKRIKNHETSQKALQKEESQETLYAPTVLITGTGDSGTRGVARACQELGMYFCESCKNEVEDNLPSLQISLPNFAALLISGNGTISPEGYQSNFYWETDTEEKLKATIRNTTTQMRAENASLDFEGLNSGIKVPSHFYLLPVYDQVFNNSVKYLMVSRDPRDTCTGQNQRNFENFGPFLEGTDHGKDCWGFYASFWTSLLDVYEFNPHFKVVRVEDLVVPEPTPYSSWLNCLAEFVELPRPSPQLSVDILSEAHEFNSSYMGHHYGMTDSERAAVEADLAARVKVDAKLRTVMSKLGYGFDQYELLTPGSPSVCK